MEEPRRWEETKVEKPPRKTAPLEELASWYARTWETHMNRPAWPFYVGDWETNPHVQRMTDRQYRQYHTLLCRAWKGPLTPDQVAEAEETVRKRFLELPSGDYQHPKILKDLAYLEGERYRNGKRRTGGIPAVLPAVDGDGDGDGFSSSTVGRCSDALDDGGGSGGELEEVDHFLRWELGVTPHKCTELNLSDISELIEKAGITLELVNEWKEWRKAPPSGLDNPKSFMRHHIMRGHRPSEASGKESLEEQTKRLWEGIDVD